MLKGIDPLLQPDLLRVLAAMGHGDELVLADTNFPATSLARHCVVPSPLHMDCDVIRALGAVLSLFPLDSFDGDPVLTMQVVGDPEHVPAVVAEAAPLFAREGFKSSALERQAFYSRAKGAFAVIQTLETRIYANFILRKGVISP